jgi:predicted site-specific integrase-resolvase
LVQYLHFIITIHNNLKVYAFEFHFFKDFHKQNGMNETQYQFKRISEAAKILGVSHSCLRKWDDLGVIPTIRTPGDHRLFDVRQFIGNNTPASIPSAKGTCKRSNPKDDRKTIAYTRVSSAKQQPDLVRQREFVMGCIADKYPGCQNVEEVFDIGSGINFKRTGLLRILGLIKAGQVQRLVVASRDRLARFAFELIEWLCTSSGTQIVVLDNTSTTEEDELGKDLMSIVQVYCCRWNGRRKYAKKDTKSKNVEVKVESNEDTEGDSESVGGVCPIHVQQDDINTVNAGEHSQGQGGTEESSCDPQM